MNDDEQLSPDVPEETQESGQSGEHSHVEEGTVTVELDGTVEAAEQEDAGQEEADTLAVPMAELRPALEAVLMVADQPLDQVVLATAVGYPVNEVGDALAALAGEYDDQGRGFELRNVAGGWRFYTREDYATVVEKFVLDGQQARLTQAALETLAVVAYRQPISRSRVSAIRGVNVDGVMRTLLTRGLVEEAGADHETGANLYRTTSYFLERIGVGSLDQLPDLAPFLPEMEDMAEELAGDSFGVRTIEPAVEPAVEPAADPTAAEPGDANEPDDDPEGVTDEGSAEIDVPEEPVRDEPDPGPEDDFTGQAEDTLDHQVPEEPLADEPVRDEPDPGPGPDER